MSLRRTPFHAFHKEAGARLVDFGGWEMPVQYTGILEEHHGCRARVGLFDVSHMGEVRILGPRALAAVQHLVTNDAAKLVDGQAMYTAMCNERGGIVDDLIVYRFGAEDYLICVNAANRDKDLAWMRAHNPHGAEIRNESEVWAQVAIQGRHAAAIVQQLAPAVDVAAIATYHFAPDAVFAGIEGCVLARTGYTGEDGFEVFLPAGAADVAWHAIHAAGAPYGLVDVGLGARDTLRLEMKYALYGNDITDDTTPLEAGLAWVTKLEKGDFVGRDAIVAQKQAGVPRRLVGLRVAERIARPHSPILHGDVVVGEVTSGTRGPSVEANIALGYVPTALAAVGTALRIDIRGKMADAIVAKTPFYTRPT
jgi:aminomethyltransferase